MKLCSKPVNNSCSPVRQAVVREHPEYFYKVRSKPNLKFKFGMPEACDWWIDMMGSFIERYDLRYNRFELTGEDPASYFTWDMIDPKGTERFAHNKGMYRMSETLTKRYPKLMLEVNAGGGNALDFGTMRRHYCAWANDATPKPCRCWQPL